MPYNDFEFLKIENLLKLDDYKNIKYKGLHRQKTIHDANEEIINNISIFMKTYSDLCGKIQKASIYAIDTLLEDIVSRNSNGKELKSFVSNEIINDIKKYINDMNDKFRTTIEDFKKDFSVYVDKNKLSKYSPKELPKKIYNSLNTTGLYKENYMQIFSLKTNEYLKTINKNKKQIQKLFEEYTGKTNLHFLEKMHEIKTSCFKKLEGHAYNKSEFNDNENTVTTNKLITEKIENAKTELNKCIEEYAINMLLKGNEYLEKLISNKKTELKKQIYEILADYKETLEKNIDEHINKKEKENQEKILNDETQFTENLTNCKKLLEQWINELKKYQKEHTSTGKKAKSHNGKSQQSKKKLSPEGRIGIVIERLETMRDNIPSSLKNINPDVCNIIDNIIDAADAKTLCSYSNDDIKSYKLPGQYKEISNANIKKSILCLIKIISSSNLKNKSFIDSYVKWVKGEKK